MSCNCTPPERTSLWTPIPQMRQPTDMLMGENIDCFARRAGDPTGLQDDAQQDPENRIQNTSIKVDQSFKVDETMTLSKGPRTATTWRIEGPPELSINNSGKLVGALKEGTYKVKVTVADADGDIDSREFTVVAATAKKGESFKLMIPYRSTNGQKPRVNSGFGPRMHPIHKVMKLHKGQDWVGGGKGELIAAADGEVVFAGTAGAYGQQVRINHLAADGSIICQTTYNHCSQLLVQRGQKVSAGQCIAKEGSTGASTGNHLHFEVLLGGKTHVDPAPYLDGSFTVQPPTQADGSKPPLQTVDNKSSGAMPITKQEAEARNGADCPKVLTDSRTPTTQEPSTAPEPGPNFSNKMGTTSGCVPEVRPSYQEVSAAIDEVLNADPELTADDKKLIRFIAQIESRFDPYAKNPTSTATGLYQFLDSLAVKYYGIIGVPPTCANRCNPKYATQAMVEFYKREIKKYWTEYKSKGTLARKTPKDTPHSQRYPQLSIGEFCYGLIHHDGVGTAVAGVDKQGVDYFRKKIRENGYS